MPCRDFVFASYDPTQTFWYYLFPLTGGCSEGLFQIFLSTTTIAASTIFSVPHVYIFTYTKYPLYTLHFAEVFTTWFIFSHSGKSCGSIFGRWKACNILILMSTSATEKAKATATSQSNAQNNSLNCVLLLHTSSSLNQIGEGEKGKQRLWRDETRRSMCAVTPTYRDFFLIGEEAVEDGHAVAQHRHLQPVLLFHEVEETLKRHGWVIELQAVPSWPLPLLFHDTQSLVIRMMTRMTTHVMNLLMEMRKMKRVMNFSWRHARDQKWIMETRMMIDMMNFMETCRHSRWYAWWQVDAHFVMARNCALARRGILFAARFFLEFSAFFVGKPGKQIIF